MAGLTIPFIVFNVLILFDIMVMQEKNIIGFNENCRVYAEKIMKRAQVIIPIGTLAFCVLYWIVALCYYLQIFAD